MIALFSTPSTRVDIHRNFKVRAVFFQHVLKRLGKQFPTIWGLRGLIAVFFIYFFYFCLSEIRWKTLFVIEYFSRLTLVEGSAA